MTLRPHFETLAAAMTRGSRDRGYLLKDLLCDCIQRAPFALADPFPDPGRLSEMEQRLAQHDFLIRPFELCLMLSEGESPFLIFQDEPRLSCTLRITSRDVTVSLVDGEHRPAATSHHAIESGWTLEHVADAITRHLETAASRKVLEEYRARWQLLSTEADPLLGAVREIAAALSSEPPVTPASSPPWSSIVSAVADAPRFNRLANALTALGRTPPDQESLGVLAQLAAKTPEHLHLALELALLTGRREGVASAWPVSQDGLCRAERLLRDFAAPGEPLPELLAERVHALLNGVEEVLAGRSPGAAPVRPRTRAFDHVERAEMSFRLEEQLVTMAIRFGWHASEREMIRDALLESDMDRNGAALRALSQLVESRDARPRELATVILVRQWCVGEGYGRLIRRHRSTDGARQPPSYDVLLNFMRHLDGWADADEVVGRLHHVVRYGFVDPDDFEPTLRRHLDLIDYVSARE